MYNEESLVDGSADRRLEVSYTQIKKLIPDPRNARTHSKRQVTQIAESISAFGFTNPVITDSDCNIIAGHGRLRAAKELNLTEVPVIVLTGLSETQKKALRLADNNIALNAGWDVEILKLELADLSLPEVDIDLGLTGFSPGEIDLVLSDSEDPDDEVIPAVPECPRVQTGDIWQRGEHRVAFWQGLPFNSWFIN